MLAKLALRNVRRSARDYAIYFVTLLFGVAVFYAFNSLESQRVLFDIKNHAVGHMLDLVSSFMGIFSVVVALVLAFLIVYANRFIIKRRKREFGTYLLLGMSSARMAAVLLAETLVVGTASLAAGLVVGVLVSQGLAFGSAALMGTTMTNYHFVVSASAIIKTLVCFALLFALTLLMNVVFISRRKLGDLITTRSDNAAPRQQHLWIRVVGFAVAFIIMALAYLLLWHNQFREPNAEFLACTCLMVAGTVLLFWSGSSIVLALVQRARGFYLKGLHAFTARQVSSKIGGAFASLSVVCVMLFFALSTVSIGFGVRAIFVGDVEKTTKYDVTFSDRFCNPVGSRPGDPEEDSYEARRRVMEEEEPDVLAAAESLNFDMAQAISSRNPAWHELIKASAQLDYYQEPQMTWGEVLAQAGVDGSSMERSPLFNTSAVNVVGISQFNAVCQLTGEPGRVLAGDQYLINNTLSLSETVADLMRTQAAPITIAGIQLTAAPDELALEVRTGAMADVGLELIVPDAVIEAMKGQGALPVFSYLNAMYSCDRVQGDDALRQLLHDAFPTDSYVSGEGDTVPSSLWPYYAYYTGNYMATQSSGMKLLITYLALYIGFVLLVSTAAIIAIQQLSETADSIGRYQRLSSLGCDKSMILGSLRAQNLLYFLVPLSVAAVHAAYAAHIMNIGLFSAFGIDPMVGVAITGVLVVLIYGCYMLVTYLASKSVVCEACGL
ncbi:MAG: ABC transporter permease [Coriobacteriales bacterium]|nr:ABC transporter permease [Coriobacteriales bacterium]